MTEKMRRRLADLKAAQEAGKYTLCPRCGMDTMKPDLFTNALSRSADIMVCDTCGVDEAKLAFMNAPMSMYQWAGLRPRRPDSDFKDLPAAQVWERVKQEQLPMLRELFSRFENGEDAAELRLEALEICPGLTQLWTEPFQAKYTCKDVSLMIRFRRTEDGIESSMSLLTGK